MNTRSDVVPLTDAIAALRKQIREAAKQAESLPENERFRITGVELELTVVAEDASVVGGEVGWWIFKGKADASTKDAITHKVKLTMNVGDIEVGGGKMTP
jgi:hypothetical protein